VETGFREKRGKNKELELIFSVASEVWFEF